MRAAVEAKNNTVGEGHEEEMSSQRTIPIYYVVFCATMVLRTRSDAVIKETVRANTRSCATDAARDTDARRAIRQREGTPRALLSHARYVAEEIEGYADNLMDMRSVRGCLCVLTHAE